MSAVNVASIYYIQSQGTCKVPCDCIRTGQNSSNTVSILKKWLYWFFFSQFTLKAGWAHFDINADFASTKPMSKEHRTSRKEKQAKVRKD